MKAKTIALTLAALSVVVLAGCGNDQYTPSEEHCKPEYWQTLPEGSDRDALIEACMTR